MNPTVIRKNPHGLTYVITPMAVLGGGHKTRVRFNSIEMILDVDPMIFLNQWFNWTVKDMMVQDAFPTLSVDEREFLKTGLTSEEWNELFPNGNE